MATREEVELQAAVDKLREEVRDLQSVVNRWKLNGVGDIFGTAGLQRLADSSYRLRVVNNTETSSTTDPAEVIVEHDGGESYIRLKADNIVDKDGDPISGNLVTGSELTIATGEITVTTSYHLVDTEGDAANDDLDTINGGFDGQILVLSSASNSRTVTARDGAGNLALSGNATLNSIQDTLTLVYSGAQSLWLQLAVANNG